MNNVQRRLLNVLVGIDQFFQVLLYMGNYTPDETISGVIGRKVVAGEANWFEKKICWLLNKLESKHCQKSIDYEENINSDW